MKPTQKSITQGIWPLAWPIILSNLSIPLLGIVDTAVLGHLPDPQYLAAVAAGSVTLSLLLWSFGFLRMGTTSLVARALGAGEDTLGIWLRGVALALVLATGLLISQFVLIPLAIGWIVPEDPLASLAASYCHIRLLSAPATLINYTLIGWFVGQQDARRPLIIVISTNILNIILDLALILGLGLNSDGAAWASVIAEYTGLALGLLLLLHKLKRLPEQRSLRHHWQSLAHWAEYLPLLQINRHLFVRTLCLLSVFAFFTAQGARLGTQVMAANAILLQFLTLTAYTLDGFAHAAEALSGKAAGAGNRRELWRVFLGSSLLASVTALSMSLLLWLGEPWWLQWFTSLPAVLAEAQQHFGWIIALPLLAVAAYQFDGIYLGTGHTRTMQNAMIGSLLLVFFPLWWLTQPLGNTGLWLAFSVFHCSRGLVLGIIFYKRWRSNRWLYSTKGS